MQMLLEQKKAFWIRKEFNSHGTGMLAVSLFWDSNMAAVTSCENTLSNIKNYINHKNSNHCVNNDFADIFLAAQMRSITLAGSPKF